VYAAATLWGLGWGGVPTLLQTGVSVAGGEHADTAQSMLVTVWNVAMAGGGVVGGLLLTNLGPMSFPWIVLLLLDPVFLVVVAAARTNGFPGTRLSERGC
jgi:predicted MFS family arabinose efflux permease